MLERFSGKTKVRTLNCVPGMLPSMLERGEFKVWECGGGGVICSKVCLVYLLENDSIGT